MPSGARSTVADVKTGSMISSMTGVIMFWESFRSLHAAPIATKSDPKMNNDITRNSRNQPTIAGVTALA